MREASAPWTAASRVQSGLCEAPRLPAGMTTLGRPDCLEAIRRLVGSLPSIRLAEARGRQARLAIEARSAPQKGVPMATTQQYRMKAAEYAALAETAQSPSEAREFRSLERNNISLAKNKEWLAGDGELSLASAHQSDEALVEEESVLRCL